MNSTIKKPEIDCKFDPTKTYGECREVGRVLLTKMDVQMAQAPLIPSMCAFVPRQYRHCVRWVHQPHPNNYHRDIPCVNLVGWVYEPERPNEKENQKKDITSDKELTILADFLRRDRF